MIGGSGFLGSHVADELSRRGFSVTIFDKNPSTWLTPDQHFVQGDLLDQALLADCCKKAKLGAKNDLVCMIRLNVENIFV